MLGAFDAWLLSSIGGLDSAVSGTTGGWKDIIVRVSPGVIAALGHASYRKRTPFGEVSLSWKYAAGKFAMELGLPVGTTATVHTPTSVAGATLRALHESSGDPAELWSAAGGAAAGAAGVRGAAAGAAGVRAVEPASEAVVATVAGGLGRGGSYRFEARFGGE